MNLTRTVTWRKWKEEKPDEDSEVFIIWKENDVLMFDYGAVFQYKRNRYNSLEFNLFGIDCDTEEFTFLIEEDTLDDSTIYLWAYLNDILPNETL